MPLLVVDAALERREEGALSFGQAPTVAGGAELLEQREPDPDQIGGGGGHGEVALVAQRRAAGVEPLDFAPHLAVDFLQADAGEGRVETGVQEQHVVDHGEGRQAAQPLAVAAVGQQRAQVAERPRRVRALPRFVRGVVEDRTRGAGEARAQPAGLDHLAVLRLLLLGLRRGDELEQRGAAHVAQLADQIERLVVAEQDDHASAGARRLLLQPHQEVHHRAHLGPAVGEVAELDQRGVAARPRQLRRSTRPAAWRIGTNGS